MGEQDDKIVEEFLVESYEGLDQLDHDLVALEKSSDSRELLARVFRAFHSIKGACGFLGFKKLQSVTHAAESLLSRHRDGELPIDPEATCALLAAVDAARQILRAIEAGQTEGDADVASVIETLRLRQVPVKSGAPSLAPPASTSSASLARAAPVPGETSPTKPPPPRVAAAPPASEAPTADARSSSPSFDAGQTRLLDPLIKSGRLTPSEVEFAERQQRLGDPRRIGEILVDQGVLEPQEVLDALVTQEELREGSLSDSKVRVDVQALDRLLNLASELVMARNQILQCVASQDYGALPATAQRLNQITSEMQEGIMKTRMQPIGNVWNGLPRLTHDVAAACGKSVRLEMHGVETELDKSVLEAIRDPITHLVRNAIDHGIESPTIRTACGKSAEGRVQLRAYHQGGQVFIEVSDDGAGLSIERIKRKALDRKLIEPERVPQMTDRDWANLIFLPGLSTAETITAVSGRGVGMDVVKTNIERIGGAVGVQSEPAHGTTIDLRIPLTLAIIPALIVAHDHERYAIPQANLEEIVRLNAVAERRDVEWIQDRPVHRLREHLIPLLSLSEVLAGPGSPAAPPDVTDGRSLNVVVLRAEGLTFGLVVDEVHDAEEIVVKPLEDPLKSVPALAGATVLGDGRVALILDVSGIARRAGLGKIARTTPARAPAVSEGSGPGQKVLIAQARADWRVAMPLASIIRLEELAPSAVERIGGNEVVQCRGHLVALVRLASVLDPATPHEESTGATLPVLMCDHRGRIVALAVKSFVDVVDGAPQFNPAFGRPGILGCGVIEGRAVDFLDLAAVLELAARRGLLPEPVEIAGAKG